MMAEPLSITGRVDRDDCLVDGDPEFLVLNAAAGGKTGAPLALSPLATIARLVRRLEIPVARRVTLADGDTDLDCWVRGRPEADGVSLTLSDMRERAVAEMRAPARRPTPPADADWTWETDARLRFTAIDPRAAGAGVDVSAMLAQPITRLFLTDGTPLADVLAAQTDVQALDVRVEPRGEAVLLTALARHDATGSFAGFVGGVTEVRGIAPEPVLTAAFVTQLDQALRPAIGRIIGRADAINAQIEGPLDAQYVDYAADIASAGRHLLGLIDDLADLQAIERTDFHVAAEPIDLADVARRASGLLVVRASDADVAIDRPDPGDSVPATGEFRRTLQVLVNLVGNAVRYSPRGASVTVAVTREGDRAVAVVSDQGRGIAAEDQVRIFEKFVRVDPGEPGGSGLGLYIARRLARAMGGDLTVESAPGEGARFTFTLPAA
jgi:signal transduction histidine kinase